MCVDNAEYIYIEFQSVLNNLLFKEYWRKGIIENKVGFPVLRKDFANSSGNLIHHIYHLTQFYNFSRKAPKDFNLIFEFGGGYGSMCRLFHNLDFDGKYIIFDFPHFIFIQNYYLKCLGYNICDYNDFNKVKSGIFLISDFTVLEDILNNIPENKNSLFIGTWSLSETDLETRISVNKLLKNFNNYLIAFQNSFGEVENKSFFQNFNLSKSNVKSEIIEIKHLPGNYYNFGML
jgi:hypothetical protein